MLPLLPKSIFFLWNIRICYLCNLPCSPAFLSSSKTTSWLRYRRNLGIWRSWLASWRLGTSCDYFLTLSATPAALPTSISPKTLSSPCLRRSRSSRALRRWWELGTHVWVKAWDLVEIFNRGKQKNSVDGYFPYEKNEKKKKLILPHFVLQELHSNRLMEFPAYFGRFVSVTALNMSDNLLTEVPAEIGLMKSNGAILNIYSYKPMANLSMERRFYYSNTPILFTFFSSCLTYTCSFWRIFEYTIF
jgi:hypothetical protein